MRPGHSPRRRTAPPIAATLAVACAFLPAPAAAAPAPLAETLAAKGLGRYAPAEAIVRFEPGTSGTERGAARRGAGVDFAGKLALAWAEVVEVEGSVLAAVRRLERQPGVAYAQPNFRYEATAVPEPNDTFFFPELWGLSDPALPDPGLSTLEAWEDPEGPGLPKGNGQVIAVADTGVDLTHPDLAPNLWTNTGELPVADGLDTDGNGKVDDIHGYDFVDDDGDPDDYEFHGTHVAGTAAAVADNNEGIAGVAPEAEIMAVRVLDGDGSGFSAEIAEGIAYAAENDADVINLSLGGLAEPEEDQLTEDAIQIAAAHNAVVVAAAGNEDANNDTEPHTPCALPNPNLVCVAALNRNGSLSSFSNFGVKSVDIAAPGGGDVAGGGILSAKVDYGAPLFSEGFEAGLGPWTTQTFNGGVPWGTSGSPAIETLSATDSPGSVYGKAVNPVEFAFSELFTDAAVDLTGERGCRVHFRSMYETEEFLDYFAAGAADEGTEGDFTFFTGTSSGYPSSFSGEEASISDLDGQNDVHPLFAILSDFEIEFDGAYVDDVRIICRDETYVDEIASGSEYDLPNAGNYIRFSGTSMATPHVSGVVALVRAAAPGLSATKAIEAILSGASAIPTPDPSRRTATEGIADACQAIAVAAGSSDPLAECPGSSENVIPPPPAPVPQPQAQVLAGPPSAVPDQTRPRTFFRQRPPRVIRTRSRKAKVVFRFGSNEAGVTFVCRVDGAPFRFCPARLVRRFRLGPHLLRVVARDAAGNADRTPAVARFRVQRRG